MTFLQQLPRSLFNFTMNVIITRLKKKKVTQWRNNYFRPAEGDKVLYKIVYIVCLFFN